MNKNLILRVFSFFTMFFPVFIITSMTLFHFGINYPQENSLVLVVCYTISILVLSKITINILTGKSIGNLILLFFIITLARSVFDETTGQEKEFAEQMKTLRHWNIYAYNFVHDVLALIFVAVWVKILNHLGNIKSRSSQP
jgi:hypothetical protein